jgi:hypothetical protein
MLDMGNLCAWCGEDTSFGSGKFVNRIPVGTHLNTTIWADAPEYKEYSEWTDVECYGCEDCYADEEEN